MLSLKILFIFKEEILKLFDPNAVTLHLGQIWGSKKPQKFFKFCKKFYYDFPDNSSKSAKQIGLFWVHFFRWVFTFSFLALQAHNSRTIHRSVTQQNIIFVKNWICNNFLLHTKSSKIKNEEVIGHILLFKAFNGQKIT